MSPRQLQQELERSARALPDKENSAALLQRIRHAFEMFDSQSSMLQNSFNDLRLNLAAANRKLQDTNGALDLRVRELQDLTSRLHCIVESLGDGVLVVNRHLIIERCNRAAEVLLEKDRCAIEGHRYDIVMNGLGRADLLRQTVLEGTSVLDDQRDCQGADGQRIHVLASVSPIISQGRTILGAVEVLRDVTRLHLLEERVQHQKRMAALGEMATSVAHEIRNPLGTIEGFARLLRKDLERDNLPDHVRLASNIVEGAQNLNYVITNLLTYARPLHMQSETFRAALLLESSREIIEESARAAQVTLTLEPPPADLTATGDIRLLRQVLVNLGRNAVEACEPGREVHLRAEASRRTLSLFVRDNGGGIKSEDLPRIFDPFFTTKQGGTGLGLSLCHKIVETHGGEIRVSSREGVGTEFRVVLPQTGGVS